MRFSLLLFCIIILCNNVINAQSNSYYADKVNQLLFNLDGDPQENLHLFQEIVDSKEWKELSCFEQGKIRHYYGVSFYFLDREKEAIEAFKNTLSIWSSCPEVSIEEIANTTYNIGIAYQYTQEIRLAKSYLDRAFKMLENVDSETYSLAEKYEGAGSYFFDVGDFENARLYFQKALLIYQKQNRSDIRIVNVLNQLLVLNVDFKNYRLAQQQYEEATELIDELNQVISEEELALLLLNGARAYIENGEIIKGNRISQRAILLTKEINDPFLESIALELLGYSAMQERQYSKALNHFQQVFELREELGQTPYERTAKANGLENLSDYYRETGQISQALEFVDESLNLMCPNAKFDSHNNPIIKSSYINDTKGVVRLLDIKANNMIKIFECSNEIDDLDMALILYKKIDSLISSKVASVHNEVSKINLYSLVEKYYSEGLKKSLYGFEQTGQDTYLKQAYFFSSKSKALVLKSQFEEKERFYSHAKQNEKHLYQQLIKSINENEILLEQNKFQSDSLLTNYLSYNRQLDALRDQVISNKKTSTANDNSLFNVRSINQIQKDLSSNSIVLEYMMNDSSLTCFWISNDTYGYETKKLGDKELNTIDNYADATRDPSTLWSDSLAYENYKLVIPQTIRSNITEYLHIIIIPDGKIHNLSFDAFSIDGGKSGDMLIDYSTISYSYSSSFLYDHSEDQLLYYVGFGTNYSSSLNEDIRKTGFLSASANLSKFNFSEDEITQSSKNFDSDYFIGEEASLSWFENAVQAADILHLSIHGLVNFEQPRLSSIIFDNRSHPFIMTASDLERMTCNAELVILSSCNTANGKIYKGEGVFGMSRAFLSAGAEQVLSSLWNASEVASKKLISSFTGNLSRNGSTTKSLRNAKRSYLKNAPPSQRHPFYWANYILIGDVGMRADKAFRLPSAIFWVSLTLSCLLLILVFRHVKA